MDGIEVHVVSRAVNTRSPWRRLRDMRDGLLPPRCGTEFEQQALQSTGMMIPVCICIVAVVLLLEVLGLTADANQPWSSIMLYVERPDDGAAEVALGCLLNSAVAVASVVFLTYLFLYLYKHELWQCLHCILVVSYWVFLAGVALELLRKLATALPLDWPLAVLVSANVAAAIVAVIFIWKPGPLKQGSLLALAVGLSWPLLCLSEWTLWLTLLAVVVWDLVAVLLPCGPLRHIMQLSQYRMMRGQPFALPPGIMYASRRFQLGLGDFVLYGVLVGRAWLQGPVVFACVALGVLAGLVATVLTTLATSRIAIPALPASLLLGLLMYFGCVYAMEPYVGALSRVIAAQAM